MKLRLPHALRTALAAVATAALPLATTVATGTFLVTLPTVWAEEETVTLPAIEQYLGTVYTWNNTYKGTDMAFGRYIETTYADGAFTVNTDNVLQNWNNENGHANSTGNQSNNKTIGVFANSGARVNITDTGALGTVRFAADTYGQTVKSMTFTFSPAVIGGIIVESGATGYSISCPTTTSTRSFYLGGSSSQTAYSLIKENFSITNSGSSSADTVLVLRGTQNIYLDNNATFTLDSKNYQVYGNLTLDGKGTVAFTNTTKAALIQANIVLNQQAALSFSGAINLDMTGRSTASEAFIKNNGSSTVSVGGAINISNYDGLYNGTYKMLENGSDDLGTKLQTAISGMASTHNRTFTYQNVGGVMSLVIADEDEIEIRADKIWGAWVDRHVTSAVKVLGGTLSIGDNGAHNDFERQTFKYGRSITVDDGATLNVQLWAQGGSSKRTILTTDKVVFDTAITLQGGANMKTTDGSYYFKQGVVVDGNATITHNYGKGLVYGAINGGANAGTDTTLTFAHDNGESAVVTFAAAGDFDGTVVLQKGNTQEYVINHSQALQNANVNLDGSPNLRMNVATATIAGLEGAGTVMLNGSDYGATDAPTAAAITITGHASGTKTFSGTIGDNISISTSDTAAQTFNNMTLGNGATLSLGTASTLSGTLALNVTSGTQMITSTGALGTMGAVTVSGASATEDYTLMSLKTATDAAAVVAAFSRSTNLTAFVTPTLVASGNLVKIQTTNVIDPSTTVALTGGLTFSNNSVAYAGTHDTATNTANLAFTGDGSLNVAIAASSTGKFTAGKADGLDSAAITINTLALGNNSTLTLAAEEGVSLGYSHTGDFLLTNGKKLILENGVSMSVSGRTSLGSSGGTLEIKDGATLTTQHLRMCDASGTPNTSLKIDGGTLEVTGDTNTHGTGTSFLLAHWPTAEATPATITLESGSLTAENAVMKLSWSGSGKFVMNGGEATLLGVDFQPQSSAASYFLINGGTLNIGASGMYGLRGNSDAQFGNATIVATDDWATANQSGQTGTLKLTATGDNATTFNTNGHSITINNAIARGADQAADGNLVKTGEGTLTLNEGAAANVTLNEGTLVVGDGKSLTSLNATGTVGGAFTTGSLTSTTSLALMTGAAITVAEDGSLSLDGVLDLTNYMPAGNTMAITYTGSNSTIADGFRIDLNSNVGIVETTGDTGQTGLVGSTIQWNIAAGLGLAKTNFYVDNAQVAANNTTYTWSDTDGTLISSSYVYNIAENETATAAAAFGDQGGTDRSAVLFQSGATLTGVTDETLPDLSLVTADGVTDANVVIGTGSFTATPTNLANYGGDVTLNTGSSLKIGAGAALGNVHNLIFNGGSLKYDGGDVVSLFSKFSGATKIDIGEYNDTWTTMPGTSSVEITGTTGTLRLEGTDAPSTLDELIVSGGTVNILHGKALKYGTLANGTGNNIPTIDTNIKLTGGTLAFTKGHGSGDNSTLAASALTKYTYMLKQTLVVDPTSTDGVTIRMDGSDTDYANGIGLGNVNALTYSATHNGGTLTIDADITGFGTNQSANRIFSIAHSTGSTDGIDVVINGQIGNDCGGAGDKDTARINLVKTGDGTLKISGANFAPHFTIQEGKVIAANAQALGKNTGNYVNEVTVGTGTNATILDLQVGNASVISKLSGNAQSSIISTAATAQTLKVGVTPTGGANIGASAFHGKVGSNLNLEVCGNTVTLDGDLSEFNGNVTVTGGNLSIANSKADATLNIGTLTLASGAGTTTLGGDTTATSIKIANGKSLTIEEAATLTYDAIKYTGKTGNGTITQTGDATATGDYNPTSSDIYLPYYSGAATVSNMKLEKTDANNKYIKTQMTNVEFVNEKGGTVEFTHADNTFTKLDSVGEVKLSGAATAVNGNSTVSMLTATQDNISLTLGEDVKLSTTNMGNSEYILNGLSGDGTLEVTGTGTVQVGVERELRTINGNVHITKALLQFNDWNKGAGNAKSPDMAIGGTVTADAKVEIVSQAELTINQSGTLDVGGALELGHKEVSDRNWGKLNVDGTLNATGGIEFRGTKSSIEVSADSTVNIGKADTLTQVTAANGSTTTNRGTFILADGAQVNVINAAISNIDFAAEDGAGTLAISAGAVLKGTVEQQEGADNLSAIMAGCSLQSTGVVIDASGAIDAKVRELGMGESFNKKFTLNIMSGVTLAAGDIFSLDLAGMEYYGDVQLHWRLADSGEPIANMLSLFSLGEADPTEINLDTNTDHHVNYTGAPIVFGSMNGQVVDVWATFTVPEPTTGALSVLGLAALAARRRRKAK